MWIKRTSNKTDKKNTNLFVTTEEWPDISEEQLKYFLEEYGKVNSIKNRRNRYLGRNETPASHRRAEEAKTSSVDINICQGRKDEFYRSASKDE